jgi:CheY-like chemotaxis protein
MRKPTILCVDDELNGPTGRESLLRQHGYDVVVTTSGREGLDLLEEVEVDAVVLDYRMPDLMGDAVAARMKQLKPEVPIMLLSARDRVPPAALGSADSFLSKSVPRTSSWTRSTTWWPKDHRSSNAGCRTGNSVCRLE